MNQKGLILVFVFIIMTGLAAVTLGFLYMNAVQLKSGGYDVQSSEAFWIAEAGLQKYMFYLKDGTYDSTNHPNLNENLGNGNYLVTSSYDGGTSTYVLTSTGSVSVISRTITESAVVGNVYPDAFDYALFGNNSNNKTLTLNNSGGASNTIEIVGDLYYDGNVVVESRASVTGGLVYANSVSGAGTYTAAPGSPSPMPTYPVLNTIYNDLIAVAPLVSNLTLNGSADLPLGGTTQYYRNLTVRNNATITGPGTIVMTGTVTLRDDANVSPNVTIIAKGTVNIRDDAIVQSESIVYSQSNITLRNSVNVTGSVIALPNKTVTVQNNAVLTGILYAGRVNLINNAVITGSVVTDRFSSNRINDNVTITFSQVSLPSTLPAVLGSSSTTVTPQADWNET